MPTLLADHHLRDHVGIYLPPEFRPDEKTRHRGDRGIPICNSWASAVELLPVFNSMPMIARRAGQLRAAPHSVFAHWVQLASRSAQAVNEFRDMVRHCTGWHRGHSRRGL